MGTSEGGVHRLALMHPAVTQRIESPDDHTHQSSRTPKADGRPAAPAAARRCLAPPWHRPGAAVTLPACPAAHLRVPPTSIALKF